ncbi:50S ribosomal protein L31 [Candidatus Cytomitobacter primus]|uniref:50S ribosomal protein L31 n=1 Tax=Candidatus Cytomitobacter primus TaxID=2066024 RepID=A0A5C0UFX2_9PROT|nr:50S ribosomal protein L31 [Candidatus Cytomitobacter primus]QEK38620.1 50S ribosomal protein L31 [Candidatus Cytomitobacter primus]
MNTANKVNKNKSAKSKHPKMNKVVLTLTDGSTVEIMSSRGGKEAVELDIDPKSHRAWTKQDKLGLEKDGMAARFSKRFGMMDI